MWICFGVLSLVLPLLNFVCSFQKRISIIFVFTSLSCAVVTLCLFYTDAAGRLLKEDLSGLIDIMPTMSRVLWIYTLLIILINGVPLMIKKD